MLIDIAAVTVDILNFRHGTVQTEPEALHALLSNERIHKVSELAQDIVDQRGLDPSSPLIIIDKDGEPGRYIALEGNRRITALKAMITPEIAVGTPGYRTFKSLHSQFLALNITQVECVLVKTREEAAIWIKRKHYTGMGGAGVVRWNAVATALSDQSEGRYRRWLSALAFLERYGYEVDDIREAIANKTTSVDRVLESKLMQTVLGLEFRTDGTIGADNGDEESAARLVMELLARMAERSFKEPLVSTGEQQTAFIQDFERLSVKKPEVQEETHTDRKTEEQGQSNPDQGSADHSERNGSEGRRSGEQPRQQPRTARPPVTRIRKKLADKGLVISNLLLNRLYAELRSLDVDSKPHTASAMIRVFLEKSCHVFLEEMRIPCINPNSNWHDFNIKLRDKVDHVLHQIDRQMTIPALQYARDIALGTRDSIHTLDSLNEAIHSHRALPTANDIVIAWDRLHPMFQLMFDYLESNRPQ